MGFGSQRDDGSDFRDCGDLMVYPYTLYAKLMTHFQTKSTNYKGTSQQYFLFHLYYTGSPLKKVSTQSLSLTLCIQCGLPGLYWTEFLSLEIISQLKREENKIKKKNIAHHKNSTRIVQSANSGHMCWACCQHSVKYTTPYHWSYYSLPLNSIIMRIRKAPVNLARFKCFH